MIITERKFGIFNIVNIYFTDEPLTVTLRRWDVVTYHTYNYWEETQGYERKKCRTTTIDLRQSDDVIWHKINRQHKRHIRRAEKNGTTVSVSNKFDEFHRFSQQFLKNMNYADPSGLNILSSKFMQKYGILLIAENQGELLGGNLYVKDEDNALLLNIAYKKLGDPGDKKNRCIYDANCLIHWEAIQYFKNLDLINYDFADLNYFGRSFGGDVISTYEYTKFNSQLTKFLHDTWDFLRKPL